MNTTIPDPTGMILQEKLDGVFCRWTGTAYLTRNGRRLAPPPWWMAAMPAGMLDGELWMGRGTFDSLVSTIQRRGSEWEGVTYQAFDMPVLRVGFESRLAMLAKLRMPAHCSIVPSRVCSGHSDLDRAEVDVVSNGGEGLVLREAGAFYRPGNFFKIKRLFPDLDRSQLD